MTAPASSPHVITLSLVALVIATLVVLPSGVLPPEAAAPSTKLDLALRLLVAAGGDQPVRVIVGAVSGRATDAEQAVAQQGATVRDRFHSIGAVTTVMRADELVTLAADPRVRSLSSDGAVASAQFTAQAAGGNSGRGGGGGDTTSVTTDEETDAPAASSDTGDGSGDASGGSSGPTASSLVLNHLRNTTGLAPDDPTGAGATVAVIDSGIAPVDDLRKITAFYDFTNGQRPRLSRKTDPFDDYGHGTHVAGLIANRGDFSEGLYQGMAPNIRLVGIKVLDTFGVGQTSDVIAAIEFVVTHRDRLEVHVINLSLGHPILEPAASDPLVHAVEAAVRAGMAVVVSAGNVGYNRDTGDVGYAGITSPGNAPSAITVGALDTRQTDARSDDIVAQYSSRGPTWYDGYAKPDLVAPGSQLFSTVSTSSQLYLDHPSLTLETVDFHGDPGHYLRLSGTSMAAAVTSGLVAAMMQAAEDAGGEPLAPNAIKAILQYTALALPDVDVLTQGAGGLNADGALALAASIDPGTPVGQWWLTQGVSETSTIAGDTLAWSQRLVWGDRLIWGNHEVYTNEEAWGLPVVWGDRLVWGDRIIWGNADNSVVWGDRLIWGIWGNDAVGFDDGTEIVYGDRIIWGNVTADRLIWGNLDDGTAGTMGVR